MENRSEKGCYDQHAADVQALIERARQEAYQAGVQDGARHGDSVVGFENLRDVGRHHGDGVAFTDAARHKPAGKSSASFSGLSPGASQRSVDDGWLFGINPLYAS